MKETKKLAFLAALIMTSQVACSSSVTAAANIQSSPQSIASTSEFNNSDYTMVVVNDMFNNYGLEAGKDIDTQKTGWSISGSTSPLTAQYGDEQGKTFLHLENSGDRTYYFAKSYKSAVKQKSLIEFDVRFGNGNSTIHLTTGGKPQDSPKNIAALSYSDSTINFNGKTISGIKKGEWYHLKFETDCEKKTTSFYITGDNLSEKIVDAAIDESITNPAVAQIYFEVDKGGSSLDFTNFSMGYIDKYIEMIGKVQKFAVNEETIKENQELINNKPTIMRKMEYLDRGLISCQLPEGGNFVSWRWLATESADIKYNLYRDGNRINPLPLTVTNFTDGAGKPDSKYEVAAVINGVEQTKEAAYDFEMKDNGLEIQLQRPKAWIQDRVHNDKNGNPVGKVGESFEYYPGDTSAADLDGDGQMELIIGWCAVGVDSSQSGFTSPQIFQGYKLDGTLMWEINIGINMRNGAHHMDFPVYDLDGDGCAEIVLKTADGTIDGTGKVIGDSTKDYRNSGGWVLDGPEFLSVFSGKDGSVIDTVDYPTPRGDSSTWQEVWGDTYGNRQDRYLGTIAYVDGDHPSVVVCRGYYTKTTLAAYDLVDGKLVQKWYFNSKDGVANHDDYSGRGNHGIGVLDVDYDGKDEIIYGASAYDHNGTGLYTLKGVGLGHGDAQHAGDLIPDRPGLEVFQPHEGGAYGVSMRDARTGELIWAVPMNGEDVGRGIAADVDPRYPGAECWGAGGYVSADGTVRDDVTGKSSSHLIWWNGDLGRNLQNGISISELNTDKNKFETIFTAKNYTHINGTKSTPMLTADLFGDWREETIYPTKDGSKIKIFTTTTPTQYRIYTLLQDPAYRTAVTWQQAGYNQPTYTGFYLGYDTKEIPIPSIYMEKDGQKITNPDLDTVKSYSIDKLFAGNELTLFINDEKAISNGAIVRIDENIEGVTPVIKDDRTLIPLRFVSNSFDADVAWDESTKGITVTKGDTVIKMTLDSATYSVNGVEKTLDVPAKSIEGRTVVPIRALSEALNMEVFWDERGLIYISDNKISLTEQDVNIMISNIKNAPLPALNDGAEIISGEQICEDQIPIIEIDASGDDGNPCQNAIDGDFSTRWSCFADGSTLDLKLISEKNIKGVAVAHWSASRVYKFHIDVSTDGKTWTRVLENVTSSGQGKDDTLEMHTFKQPVKAGYVRLVGFGSEANNCTHVTEIAVIESK